MDYFVELTGWGSSEWGPMTQAQAKACAKRLTRLTEGTYQVVRREPSGVMGAVLESMRMGMGPGPHRA